MKKDLTELVFILDRSGSMTGLEGDTIGGFNAMLEKQKKVDGDALVSTVLFDDRSEVIHDRLDIKKMEPLTDKEYYVRGSTALLDAVGFAIQHIGNVHRYARDEDRPESTLFVITTDGMENASRHFRYEEVKKLIEKQQNKHGWEFIFLGANIDAAKEAERFGIKAGMAADYHADSVGVCMSYGAASDAVVQLRVNKQLNENWKNLVDDDFNNRKKK